MALQSGLNNIKPCEAVRFVGIANLAIAAIGLIALIENVNAFHIFSEWFISEYGPSIGKFHRLSEASALLLVLLAYSGVQLLRRIRHAMALCNVLFVAEIAYFLILWLTWTLPFRPLSPIAVVTGLMNAGIALQIVTVYPVIGLILLSRARPLFRGTGDRNV